MPRAQLVVDIHGGDHLVAEAEPFSGRGLRIRDVMSVARGLRAEMQTQPVQLVAVHGVRGRQVLALDDVIRDQLRQVQVRQGNTDRPVHFVRAALLVCKAQQLDYQALGELAQK